MRIALKYLSARLNTKNTYLLLTLARFVGMLSYYKMFS